MSRYSERGDPGVEYSSGFFIDYTVGEGIADKEHDMALNVCRIQGANAAEHELLRVRHEGVEVLLLTSKGGGLMRMGGGNGLAFSERFQPIAELVLGEVKISLGQQQDQGVCVVNLGQSWLRLKFAQPMQLQGMYVVAGGETFSLGED